MKVLTFFLMLLLMFAYAIVGGIILRYIEIYNEEYTKRSVNSTIYGIIESHPCINSSDIEQLEAIIWRMDPNSVYLSQNGSALFRSKFDIRSSILIACGLYNGFGFENGFPETVGGKAFFAIFSILVGFFQFFVMYIMGELFDVFLRYIYTKMLKKFNSRTVSRFYSFRQVILSTIGLIFLILIPAAIVYSIELWSFGESLYFAFIYVLTIGFGDYSPGSSDVRDHSEDFVQWYRICIGFWLMISVMWFAIILFQLYTVIGEFLWESTEDILDEGMDHVKDAVKDAVKANHAKHARQVASLPMKSGLEVPPPPPLRPVPSPSSSQPTTLTSASDQFAFPSLPSLTIFGQESSGEVSLIKF